VYRPVGLRQTDLGLQYGSPGRIAAGFTDDFDDLADTIISAMRSRAREQNDERAYNRLGIYAARLARYDDALDAFQRATRLDSGYIEPRVNLGAVRYLERDYVGALAVFEDAVSVIERAERVPRSLETKVYINLAKTHYELGQYGEAEELYRRASQVSPEAVSGFDYLAEADSSAGSARASEAASGPPILFADEPSE
jgi:tetratricopeptide (TPR) repeat protein